MLCYAHPTNAVLRTLWQPCAIQPCARCLLLLCKPIFIRCAVSSHVAHTLMKHGIMMGLQQAAFALPIYLATPAAIAILCIHEPELSFLQPCWVTLAAEWEVVAFAGGVWLTTVLCTWSLVWVRKVGVPSLVESLLELAALSHFPIHGTLPGRSLA